MFCDVGTPAATPRNLIPPLLSIRLSTPFCQVEISPNSNMERDLETSTEARPAFKDCLKCFSCGGFSGTRWSDLEFGSSGLIGPDR